MVMEDDTTLEFDFGGYWAFREGDTIHVYNNDGADVFNVSAKVTLPALTQLARMAYVRYQSGYADGFAEATKVVLESLGLEV